MKKHEKEKEVETKHHEVHRAHMAKDHRHEAPKIVHHHGKEHDKERHSGIADKRETREYKHPMPHDRRK